MEGSAAERLSAAVDEPYWVWCTRECVIPSVVFAAMLFYLVTKVLVPFRQLRNVTRQSAEDFMASEDSRPEEQLEAKKES